MKTIRARAAGAAALLLAAAPLCAMPRGKQELVKAGSWIYDALAAIAMEEGHVFLVEQAPLSLAEVDLMLREADYGALSPAGRRQYDRILDYMADDPWDQELGIFSLGIAPSASLDGFAKTNNDIGWVYDRYERQPLVLVPTTFQAGDYATMSVDLVLRENKGMSLKNGNYTNVPINLDQIDVNFPDTGYLSAGLPLGDSAGMNFQIGMGQQSVGRSLSGSSLWSEYFTGASYANLEFFSTNVRYNMNVTEFNVDKFMYTHRLDARFFKKLHATIMESMLVNAPMELRFFNPWTIYHGTSAWEDYGAHENYVCAYFVAKLSYSPAKYLRLYGHFAFDQWQTYFERRNWPDDTTPNGVTFQLGAESYIPYWEGYFHLWIEGTYTDPYMYIKEGPNWSLVRTYQENIGGKAVFYEWLGSPFGPDTVAGELSAGYEVPGRWGVSVSYLFKAGGEYSGTNVFTNYGLDWGGSDRDFALEDDDGSMSEQGEAWVYPDSDKEGGEDYAKEQQSWLAPHGTVEYTNRIAVRATWCPTDYLTLGAQPAFVFIFNHNNKRGDFACGGELALTSTIKLTEVFK